MIDWTTPTRRHGETPYLYARRLAMHGLSAPDIARVSTVDADVAQAIADDCAAHKAAMTKAMAS